MGRQPGFFDLEERLAGLSAKGDGLERLIAVVDFELFRPELEAAVPRADRSQGGRPPFDHVLMFKVLVLQTQNNLSDERTEFYLRDRLTPPLSADSGPGRWMRFLGLGLGGPVPDATICQKQISISERRGQGAAKARSGPSVKRFRRPEQSSGCLICSTGSSALPAT